MLVNGISDDPDRAPAVGRGIHFTKNEQIPRATMPIVVWAQMMTALG
jgi:hypothetical protein